MNVGDYLTGSNPAMGSTDYLGSGFGDYLSTGGSGPDAPNFTFGWLGLGLQATLLFSDSPSDYPYNYLGMSGTSIGLYDVADPNQKETLFAAGTLYNPANPNGVYNNNVTPQSPVSVGSWANYGVYVYTCGLNNPGNAYCNMFYSNAALNTSGTNQHFALFENPASPNTFYIGVEDSVNGSSDYSDAIFELQTGPNQTFNTTDDITATTVTPEPATWSILGIGVAALVVFKRVKPSRV